MKTNRHIANRGTGNRMGWLLSILLLCLTACSSADEEQPRTQVPAKAPTKLYIYVYAPEAPEVTRAASYDGDVDAVGNEAAVYSMQIWVFTHDTHQLIGYYAPAETPGLSTAHPYELLQLTIDEDYAKTAAASREHVDVYVLGNVTPETCNVTLDENTTQTALEAAVMAKTTRDPFGVSSPVEAVPENVGLPMSGVLRDQPVTGDAPVLRLDDGGSGIATVVLRRMVSKLRFAFSSQTGSEPLRINSIKLGSEMIPMAEYLFMSDAEPYDRHTCHIRTADGYDASTPELLAEAISEVPTCEAPVVYAWGNEELQPQLYENRIEKAVRDGYLTHRFFYLRESDKKLQGTIKYQIGDGEEQTATFRMVDNGGFSRNHVWTVYAYQAQARLHVVVANVTPWKVIEKDYDFYNW